MATAKGAIRGYTEVAAVDAAHHIVVDAQAHDTGSERELLLPVVDASSAQCSQDTAICADAGYHSKKNLAALAWRNTPPPPGFATTATGSATPRCADQAKHKAEPDTLWDKSEKAKEAVLPDAQRRNNRAPWIRELGKLTGGMEPTASARGIGHGTRQGEDDEAKIGRLK